MHSREHRRHGRERELTAPSMWSTLPRSRPSLPAARPSLPSIHRSPTLDRGHDWGGQRRRGASATRSKSVAEPNQPKYKRRRTATDCICRAASRHANAAHTGVRLGVGGTRALATLNPVVRACRTVTVCAVCVCVCVCVWCGVHSPAAPNLFQIGHHTTCAPTAQPSRSITHGWMHDARCTMHDAIQPPWCPHITPHDVTRSR
jgi:hypothetical protein